MEKCVKALSIFPGIIVICIGVVSVYRSISHQSTQQDNDAFANNYNHKIIYLKGRSHSVRDKKKYYEVKLGPVEVPRLSLTQLQRIPCKFSMEQKKNLESLKEDKILVIQGNISIDKGLFNHLEMNSCVVVDKD